VSSNAHTIYVEPWHEHNRVKIDVIIFERRSLI